MAPLWIAIPFSVIALTFCVAALSIAVAMAGALVWRLSRARSFWEFSVGMAFGIVLLMFVSMFGWGAFTMGSAIIDGLLSRLA